MCGIGCIIHQKNNSVLPETIKPFLDIISHRGPDDEGFFYEKNIALGHRRLSIIDLSKDGHQPMIVDDLAITYNGEIYNYIELRKELEAKKYSFKTKTDTEVILAAYKEWGQECLNKFNGMWAFVIYDKAKQKLFVSRDRFGVKPLYYSTVGDMFAVGSEIKQFTTLPDWKAKMNVSLALDFLIYGLSDHTNKTFFENIFQLKGGHKLIYDLNKNSYNVSCWYELYEHISKSKIDYKEACNSFKNILNDSVKLRLRADVKVGSCLSGGLDSSSIVSLINAQLKENKLEHLQETVSSCAVDKKFDESEFIDELVNERKIINHKIFPGNDSLISELDKLIWHQDEPFASTSIFAQWEVFKEAKQKGLIVMLDGQGADESLAGYDQYFQVYLGQLLKQLKFAKCVSLFSWVKSRMKINSTKLLSIIFVSLLPKSIGGKMRKKNNQRNHPYINSEILNNSTYFDFPVYSDVKKFSADMLRQLHVSKLLHYEDRNSMAHSVESRVPFLDYRFVEFILSLPSEFVLQQSVTKKIMRDAMKGIVPSKILDRKDKMGFVTPETEWIKSNSAFWINELKKAVVSLNGLIKEDFINRFEEEIKTNKLAIGSVYWRVIILGKWKKKFNVKYN